MSETRALLSGDAALEALGAPWQAMQAFSIEEPLVERRGTQRSTVLRGAPWGDSRGFSTESCRMIRAFRGVFWVSLAVDGLYSGVRGAQMKPVGGLDGDLSRAGTVFLECFLCPRS